MHIMVVIQHIASRLSTCVCCLNTDVLVVPIAQAQQFDYNFGLYIYIYIYIYAEHIAPHLNVKLPILKDNAIVIHDVDF